MFDRLVKGRSHSAFESRLPLLLLLTSRRDKAMELKLMQVAVEMRSRRIEPAQRSQLRQRGFRGGVGLLAVGRGVAHEVREVTAVC